MSYQASGLVVVQLHEHVFQSARVSRIILLALSRVDEARCEPVAVVGIVAASSPLPVVARRPRGLGLGPSHLLCGGRSLASAAAARRDVTLATRPTNAVHDAGRQ